MRETKTLVGFTHSLKLNKYTNGVHKLYALVLIIRCGGVKCSELKDTN